MKTTETKAIPRWKVALKMIANPGEVIKSQMNQVPWPYSLLISGLSFTLFFLQTGLDMFRTGQMEVSTVIIITLLGLLYGTCGVALIAVLAWAFSQASKREYSITWAISSFSLGYSATLIYALIGVICSLTLGWNTAVAFGVTGVLWALRPALFTIRQMSGDRIAFSIVLTTLCGAILLFGWAGLGRFGF
ncbi:hypothetical protein LPY66_13295 [Dehalobacter sp. DCM]|uniref:hypothetical protein n=1 Tax=Dehalobacter sp. DCM TaxID=2907827 RepID=UPI0030821584|nr:hypothetical protein LPY66_13295 [Dehalobacter sp. DCM]